MFFEWLISFFIRIYGIFNKFCGDMYDVVGIIGKFLRFELIVGVE